MHYRRGPTSSPVCVYRCRKIDLFRKRIFRTFIGSSPFGVSIQIPFLRVAIATCWSRARVFGARIFISSFTILTLEFHLMIFRSDFFSFTFSSVKCISKIYLWCFRGENISCFLLERGENHNQCRKTFILNTNLKGWIPQSVVNLALIDTLFDYMRCLKLHISKKFSSEYEEI